MNYRLLVRALDEQLSQVNHQYQEALQRERLLAQELIKLEERCSRYSLELAEKQLKIDEIETKLKYWDKYKDKAEKLEQVKDFIQHEKLSSDLTAKQALEQNVLLSEYLFHEYL